jgi:hypothetical protein
MPSGLNFVPLAQRLGAERTSCFQVTLERSQIGVGILFEHPNADFVDSRGTSVTFYRFECLSHQPVVDSTRQ